MKYCSKCGKEIMDDAVVCVHCGCMVTDANSAQTTSVSNTTEKKFQVSIIFGIVGIVFAWLFALIGHISSIIGIIIGIKEYKATEKMTGLSLSIIGEVCSIISSIIGAVAMSSAF